jgi:3-oxoacyl-[acyl-carrier protein] reductase
MMSGGDVARVTVLVTGASDGIGAAICQLMARRGARVILHYRSDRAAAESTQRALPGEGHTLVQADLGDPAQVQRLWQEISTRERIGVLVNNAGIFPDHPPLTTDYADWTAAWQQTLSTNLLGPAHLSFCAARAMAQQSGGRIVSVSSRGAFRGEPGAHRGACTCSSWRRGGSQRRGSQNRFRTRHCSLTNRSAGSRPRRRSHRS